MKVLITGGTGFLGGALARRLHALSADVTALGRNRVEGRRLPVGIRFLQADLTDREAIVDACRGQDVVFHCGAYVKSWGRYAEYYGANVVGTENVIQGCLRHQIGRLVHVSTSSLYFTYESRLNVSESDPLPPKQVLFYPQTKLLAEQAIDSAHREGLPVITIRPRAIFGPGDQTILPQVLRRLEQKRLRIIGDGSNITDLTYIDNVVDALLLCMESPASTLGQKYNITNGEPRRLWGIIEQLCTELGYLYPRQKIPFKVVFWLGWGIEILYRTLPLDKEPNLTRYSASIMANSFTLNMSAARRDLGYSPRISIDEGLERVVSWWKDTHP